MAFFCFVWFWCSLQAPTRAQNRSVNEQKMTEFATGLMIGKFKSNCIYSMYKNVSNFWPVIGSYRCCWRGWGLSEEEGTLQTWAATANSRTTEEQKEVRNDLICWMWVFEFKPLRAQIFTWPYKLNYTGKRSLSWEWLLQALLIQKKRWWSSDFQYLNSHCFILIFICRYLKFKL